MPLAAAARTAFVGEGKGSFQNSFLRNCFDI